MPDVILACNLAAATITARDVLGFEVCGRNLAKDRDGRRVILVSSWDRAAKMPCRGQKLYLGKTWIFAYGNEKAARQVWEEGGGSIVPVYEKHSDVPVKEYWRLDEKGRVVGK